MREYLGCIRRGDTGLFLDQYAWWEKDDAGDLVERVRPGALAALYLADDGRFEVETPPGRSAA